MAILKPSPSFPNIFSAGTITLSSVMLQEDAALMPSLSSLLPFVKPETYNNNHTLKTITLNNIKILFMNIDLIYYR